MTSPNPVYRFLLPGVSFFLQNLWIRLRWRFCRAVGKGRRTLEASRLRLWQRAKYDYVQEITAPDPPRL